MIIQQSPFANSVTPFSTLGKQAVGEESVDAKAEPIPPVEELAESAGTLNRKDPNDNSAEIVRDEGAVAAESENDDRPIGREQQNRGSENVQFSEDELREIEQLAARDREVRAHEQAHVSVGGQYTGAASLSFQEGPNGVRYAIGGEVSISSGAVPGDPQATVAKAQQVQRAALAPADPSTQDRMVAANAARLALEARADISQQQTEERVAERTESQEKVEQRKATEEAHQEELKAKESEGQKSESLKQQRQEGFDINQRLLGIGVSGEGQDVGSLLDDVV